MKVSIVIVHYKAKKELYECLDSIYSSNIKIPFQAIVVDNDDEKNIEKALSKRFKKVLYIRSPSNIGFGAGNNLGVRYSKGEFLFFLNPDTILQKDTVDRLVEFIEKNKNIGIAAPLLLDRNNKPYPLQGTCELNPLNGIIGLSFLNKLFPNNPISKNYWLLDWNKKNAKEVDVVPGTALMVRKNLFEQIGGFDESFFLFFEENDLCKRVKRLGYKIFINPKSRVIHLWGKSTSQFKDTKTIFAKSRFKYFQKHYGVIWAVLVGSFLVGINKLNLLLSVILTLALFLRLYRLSELMPFIGDQGWFYLSARDMLLTGNIPLVGPETSHPWIHHGPLWTYTLAIILWLFDFNPIPPAYFVAFLGVITVWLMYKVSADLFSKKVGLIAAAFYATSPLIVLNSRMPYHTSPLPFFTLLLVYMVYKWLQGNVRYVPFIFFLMAVLYNHEFTTFVLFIPILLLALYGFWRKKKWAIGILNRKIIFYSLFAFLIPMLPFVIYDINHGYRQTIGFLVWLFYRIIKFPLNVLQPDLSLSLLQQQSLEFLHNLSRLIFEPNLWVSLLIFITSIIYLIYLVLITCLKSSCFPSLSLRTSPQTGAPISKCMGLFRCFAPRNDKWRHLGIILLFLYLSISMVGLFMHRIPIEADTLLISPFVVMTISVILDKLANMRSLRIISICLVVFVCFANSYFLFKNYLLAKSGENRMTFADKINAVESIIKIVKGKEYNLIGRGVLDNFPVFTMPYEYLLWWKGNPVTKEDTDIKIVVWEKEGEIIVYEQK